MFVLCIIVVAWTKVDENAKIRNRCNQISHPAQDTGREKNTIDGIKYQTDQAGSQDNIWAASWQNKRNGPVWSESSLCAQWVAKDPRFLRADSTDCEPTGWMPGLIVFTGRTIHFVGIVVQWLIFSPADGHQAIINKQTKIRNGENFKVHLGITQDLQQYSRSIRKLMDATISQVKVLWADEEPHWDFVF